MDITVEGNWSRDCCLDEVKAVCHVPGSTSLCELFANKTSNFLSKFSKADVIYFLYLKIHCNYKLHVLI